MGQGIAFVSEGSEESIYKKILQRMCQKPAEEVVVVTGVGGSGVRRGRVRAGILNASFHNVLYLNQFKIKFY